MMKKLYSLALVFSLLFGMDVYAKDPVHGLAGVTLEEYEGRTCGTPYLIEHADQIMENTLRLNPQAPAALSKETRTNFEVGDTLSFVTANWVTNVYESTLAYCRFKSEETYIFVGANEFDEGKITQAAVDSFYSYFELRTPSTSVNPNKGIRALENEYYGKTPNKSGDGYVYILIYDINDGYDPGSGKKVYIAGYFSPNDQGNSSYSNKKDLIYVDCYPQNPISKGALATVAHEFQHLIHYGLDRDEESWVNEGASEYTEVLCGFSLRSPGYYLQHPERSLLEFDALNENLWDYQKVALWTYYLAEKFGNECIGEIVRNPGNGVEGVRSALTRRGISLSFEDIFSNFVIANYADDPALEANGYYAYNSIRLPVLPGSTVHSAYPLAEQSKNLPKYSARYARLTGVDSTAVLHVTAQSGNTYRGRVFETGASPVVNSIAFDSNMMGSYALQSIGRTADADVFMSISLGSNNLYTYSVSTELKDVSPPVILSGPMEVVPTAQSITITWETDELSTSLVEYGLTSDYGSVMRDTTYSKMHAVTLLSLQPNLTYHYRVGSTDVQGNGPRYSVDFVFTTSSSQVKTVAQLQQAHSFGYYGRSMARTPDGKLHLVYHELDGDRRFVHHVSSGDNGATWSETQLLGESLYHSGMPSLAVDKLGRLHASWHARAQSSDKLAIYYSRSDDSGDSWSSPQRISSDMDGKDVLYAAAAVDHNDNPHVVWNLALYDDDYAGDIYHNYSSDGGATWHMDRLISSGEDARRCFVPTIDFTPAGEAWVFWVDGQFENQSRKVYCTSSSNFTSWRYPEAVSTSGVLYDRNHAMVIDNQGRVHVAYADNYTPGDIRIMYRVFADGQWGSATPVAKSLSGNVLMPSLSCDPADNLYMLYLDDQGTTALGKNISAPPQQGELALQKNSSAVIYDVFLSATQAGSWMPSANISNDAQNNLYAELPRRVPSGSVDAIWMTERSATRNDLQYFYITTTIPASTKPLAVTSVYPAAGTTGVPYFKQSFYITIDFDQRVITDSLTANNFTVTSAAAGNISGLISYDASQRRLKFIASQNLPPDDVITVRLRGNVAQTDGVGLDGNGNGLAENAPVDDYVWSFATSSPDVTSPSFTIGVLQNPVFSRYLDIYVIGSEMLITTPELKVSGVEAPLRLVPGERPIYKADYRLESSGVISLQASGADLAGNAGSNTKEISAQFVMAETGGDLLSVDGHIQVHFPRASLRQDGYMTLVESEVKGAHGQENERQYLLGPAQLSLQQPAEIQYRLPAGSQRIHQFELQQPDGSWLAVRSQQLDDLLTAKINHTGAIRVIATAQSIPAQFALHQNYPNPFRLGAEKTNLVFELPQRQELEVIIYNILGEKVRTLVKGVYAAGIHTLQWDGRRDDRSQVASGVYFYQCKVAQQTFTRKLLILQ